MNQEKIRFSIANLEKALLRLEEALNAPLDEKGLIADAAIQRFEFTYELFWKTTKRVLEYSDIHTKNPRETFKHAFQQGWLKNESVWKKMRDDRNATSHEYDQGKAQEIYVRIKDSYFLELRQSYHYLLEVLNGAHND